MTHKEDYWDYEPTAEDEECWCSRDTNNWFYVIREIWFYVVTPASAVVERSVLE